MFTAASKYMSSALAISADAPLIGGVLFITSAVFIISRSRYDYYTVQCLTEGVPSMSASILQDKGDCSKIFINGRPVIVTSNPDVISHIFGAGQAVYTQRFGEDDGLLRLGMHESGVIWNNDPSRWKKASNLFKSVIADGKKENKAALFAMAQARRLFDKAMLGSGSALVDVLGVCRRITFRVTLFLFFGIDDVDDSNLDEPSIILAIVAYFKAWEYFLLRPERFIDATLQSKHCASVKCLQDHVRKLLLAAEQQATFYSGLREMEEKEREQLALEMLLAGTDTSSVSTFYAVLALCEHTHISDNLTADLLSHSNAVSACSSDTLKTFIYEVLRCKPVGPVVIRQAIEQDILPNGMIVHKGDGVIVNLECLHHRHDCFPDPHSFDPIRFDEGSSQLKNYHPFGKGVKSCPGHFLGVDEMKAILTVIIPRYSFTSSMTLGSLETHWDIANQPNETVQIRMSVRPIHLVVTGAHSTGKTYLCGLLRDELSLPIIWEIARHILTEWGWSKNDLDCKVKYLAFSEEIQSRQIHQEMHHVNAMSAFLSDRSLDFLGYMYWKGYDESMIENVIKRPCVTAMIARHRSSLNVIIDPTEACLKNDGVRMNSSLDELHIINNLLMDKVFHKFKIPVLRIDRSIDLADRARFVSDKYSAMKARVAEW